MPNAVYIAQTQQGTGSGLDAADAKAVTYFNTGSNWTSGTPTGIQIGPGTTVHLCGTISTPLTVQGSGASGNPVTIFFEPNAVMSAASWPLNPSTGAVGLGAAINGYVVDYITVDGGTNGQINATNQNTASGLYSDGVQFSYGNGIEVRNLTILNIYKKQTQADLVNNAGAGINIYRQRNNTLIHNNVVTSAGACITTVRDTGNFSGCQIYNNTLKDANWCIQSGDIDGTSIFSNYQIYGNDITMPGTIWDDPQDQNHHNGIYIWAEHDGSTITGLQIYNNYIHGDPGANTTSFIYLSANGTPGATGKLAQGLNGVLVYNNVIVATGTNNPTGGNIFCSLDGFFIYNNTLASIDVQGFGTRSYTGSVANSKGTIQNNIFANMATDNYNVGGVATLTMDHNVDTTLSTFVNGTTDASTSSAQNFRIISSSGARNAALNKSSVFTSDFNGVLRPGGTTAWDAGGFQYAAVVPTFPIQVASTSTVTALTFHGATIIRHFPFTVASTSTVTALNFHGSSAAGFTVGPTSPGSQTGTYTGIGATQVTLTQPGKISSMSMFWSTAGVSYILGIYDSTTNKNLLASTAVGVSTVGTNTLPIANGPVLAAGTYYLGFQVQGAVGGYYDQPSGAVGLFNNGQSWTGTLPSTFPTSGTASGQYLFSVYATFAPIVVQHFPLTVASTSTVTALSFHGANVATFTMGPTSPGANVASQPGIGASQVTLTQAGILRSISIFSADATPNNLLLGVYADAGNVPGALLASTAVTPTSSTGLITVPIANGPTLAPGNYWLAQQAQNPFAGYYDTPVGNALFDTSVPYTGTLINPYTSGTAGGPYQISIYATLVGPTVQNFPFTVTSTSTVTRLGYETARHFPFTVQSTSTVTALNFETAGAAQHFPLTVASTSTVTALWQQTIGKHFPFTVASVSTVTKLGFETGRRFPFAIASTSTVTALGLRVQRRFPFSVASTSSVTALGFETAKRFPFTVASTSSVTALAFHQTLLLHFPVSVHSNSTVTALGYEVARHFALTVASTSTVTALGLEVQRAGFGFTVASTSTVTRLLWSLPVQDFPFSVTSTSTVTALGWENDHFHAPLIVPSYSGSNQQTQIQVPARIAYREAEREEGPWVMPPYANLYPGGEQGGTAFVPPPVQKTDLWAAMQTWPL